MIATPVGGIPELIDSEDAGYLLAERSAVAIATAVRAIAARPRDRLKVAAQAARFGWEPTIGTLRRIIRETAAGT